MGSPSALLGSAGFTPVEVGNSPNAIPTGRPVPVTLLDATYTGKTTNFNETAFLNTAGYQFLSVEVYVTSAWSGTTPQLQLDLLSRTDDQAQTLDYYNNGGHGGGFIYTIGPGMNNNVFLPKTLSFAYIITGTTPSVNFRIIVHAW